ncbi:monosaccharide ABC transporter ATP-binding protein, CUT2 family [Caloramator quimbayensis]|uniref:Monosaccharide ABC transporter ATP-binding protein, CUT2 family n=1 Tax=Caloramator quimbayensis TaxID=1147123 RepID=A0A1T4WKB1_9CLOT|nr:sugar ABC transporter ATP-binding protein [Caloramator quimbayensis]SKA77770.1 monosaccharide ABC transporter ATP-binding protein, CUT2 family [Caloramator quimbayensis]
MQEKMPILEMKNISKSFPGVKALSGVNLRAFSGEVMALLGENGAGKSTLMKILSGVYKRDEGIIRIEGREVEINGIKDAQNLGISIIHQELSLLPNLTIYENLFLGNEILGGFKLNKREMIKKSEELLKSFDFTVSPKTLTKELTVGEMQMVEIIKAVSKDAKIIIMDEPTTALTEVETEKLFKIIERLKNNNVAIIYISHRMDEIFKICDKITVLRDGTFIGEEDVKGITKDKLISMMVGRKLEEQFPRIDTKIGKSILKVENLSMKDKIKDVSFELFEGEILGVAGLMGSGRTEVAKLIFGEYKKSSGNVYIEGKKADINSPKDGIREGIAYLSEDRKKEGLILKLSVLENMTLSNLKKYESKVKRINRAKELEDCKAYTKKLLIKTSSPNQLIKNLSGGNQQKVIIAKWLLTSPKVFIIDEPTRGIDVGAKKEIYQILNELKAQGKGIIMISSDMEEILGVSDRILVMHEGRITGEIQRDKASQEKIMKYAVGIAD